MGHGGGDSSLPQARAPIIASHFLPTLRNSPTSLLLSLLLPLPFPFPFLSLTTYPSIHATVRPSIRPSVRPSDQQLIACLSMEAAVVEAGSVESFRSKWVPTDTLKHLHTSATVMHFSFLAVSIPEMDENSRSAGATILGDWSSLRSLPFPTALQFSSPISAVSPSCITAHPSSPPPLPTSLSLQGMDEQEDSDSSSLSDKVYGSGLVCNAVCLCVRPLAFLLPRHAWGTTHFCKVMNRCLWYDLLLPVHSIPFRIPWILLIPPIPLIIPWNLLSAYRSVLQLLSLFDVVSCSSSSSPVIKVQTAVYLVVYMYACVCVCVYLSVGSKVNAASEEWQRRPERRANHRQLLPSWLALKRPWSWTIWTVSRKSNTKTVRFVGIACPGTITDCSPVNHARFA